MIFCISAHITDELTHCWVIVLCFFDEASLYWLAFAFGLLDCVLISCLMLQATLVAKSTAINCLKRWPHCFLLLHIHLPYRNVDHLVDCFSPHEFFYFSTGTKSSQFSCEAKLDISIFTIASSKIVQISRSRFLLNKSHFCLATPTIS